ncbi:terminase gpA endonuclease subunit [Litorimonas sp. WD9-15]|uniref:terminase gpA endonuclease subunit n=1 Tax=Litorimonas sp. WD9-15 TaxID=3418716 RepID=UPI003CFFB43F
MKLPILSRHVVLSGLTSATVMFAAFAEAATPQIQTKPSDWAAKYRVVGADSGSRFPGPWDPARVTYLEEIMDACGPSDPSRIIAVIGCAQSAKSEAGLNAVGRIIHEDPKGILIVLPTFTEALKYSEIKLDPMISSSPELTRRVYARHGTKRSTQMRRRFRDGFLQMASGGATSNLQMITVGFIILEEVAEYDEDEGERGDPVTQAIARGTTYGEDLKVYIPSTPGKAGSCRVTKFYNDGDQRRWAWECPHCEDWFIPRFSHLVQTGEGSSARVELAPPCCGALIGHALKRSMNAGGCWIPTFDSENPDNPTPACAPDPRDPSDTRIKDVIPAADIAAARARDTEGRDKSFHIWQGMSPFSTWKLIFAAYLDAKDDPAKMIAFTQQVLGEAYDAELDTPDDEKLFAMAGGAPRAKTSPVRRGMVPNWAAFTTTAADLQGNRFEWASYAWGPGPRGACIDHGIIQQPPMQPGGWTELRRTFAQEFDSVHLRPQIARRMGIDTGGQDTDKAYRFIVGNPDVIGIKGMTGPTARFEPLWQPSRKGGKLKNAAGQTIQRVPLTLLNTHLLKRMVYQGLTNSLSAFDHDDIGPGLHLFFHDEIDREFTKQLTAEHLVADPIRNHEAFVRVNGRANEQLDLAVYNLVLAIHFGLVRMSPQDWEDLFLREAVDPVLADLTPLELFARESEAVQPLPRQSDKSGNTTPNWLQRMIAANREAGS